VLTAAAPAAIADLHPNCIHGAMRHGQVQKNGKLGKGKTMTMTPRMKGAHWTIAAASFVWMLLVVSLGAPSATAADYNIRMHTNQPALTSSYHFVFGKSFSDLASKYSDGRVKVTIFPSSQLGRDPEVFQQIQIGAVQMGIFAFPNVVEFYAPLNVFNMPYMFDDFDGSARALMGPTAQRIYRTFEEKVGVKTLGVFNGGFRGITNSVREIPHPDRYDEGHGRQPRQHQRR
jgi:TRAP-type C4-dicarboxylate transport system substrate-binding protein